MSLNCLFLHLSISLSHRLSVLLLQYFISLYMLFENAVNITDIEITWLFLLFSLVLFSAAIFSSKSVKLFWFSSVPVLKPCLLHLHHLHLFQIFIGLFFISIIIASSKQYRKRCSLEIAAIYKYLPKIHWNTLTKRWHNDSKCIILKYIAHLHFDCLPPFLSNIHLKKVQSISAQHIYVQFE